MNAAVLTLAQTRAQRSWRGESNVGPAYHVAYGLPVTEGAPWTLSRYPIRYGPSNLELVTGYVYLDPDVSAAVDIYGVGTGTMLWTAPCVMDVAVDICDPSSVFAGAELMRRHLAAVVSLLDLSDDVPVPSDSDTTGWESWFDDALSAPPTEPGTDTTVEQHADDQEGAPRLLHLRDLSYGGNTMRRGSNR